MSSLTFHHSDFIMSTVASQITSLTIVYWNIYSGTDQEKHQSSASPAFVRGIHRWPENSLYKGPVMRKMFPFDDVIMYFIESFKSPVLLVWFRWLRYVQCRVPNVVLAMMQINAFGFLHYFIFKKLWTFFYMQLHTLCVVLILPFLLCFSIFVCCQKGLFFHSSAPWTEGILL